MLGIRKATKKASVTGPAPKISATIMSRAKPSTRLARVAAPIEPSAPTTWCSGERSVALTLKSLPRSGMIHDGQRDPHLRSPGKESPVGEHEVGQEADAPERAPPHPQSRRPFQG